jgi:hypothetical protein
MGEEAVTKAREMVEQMRHYDGADTWLRVIVVFGEPGEPPTEAPH